MPGLRTIIILSCSFIWGLIWAAVLQFTTWGRWLAARRTWITVIVGVGVDLILAMILIPWRWMRLVVGVVALSSIGIIAQSLWKELQEQRDLERYLK